MNTTPSIFLYFVVQTLVGFIPLFRVSGTTLNRNEEISETLTHLPGSWFGSRRGCREKQTPVSCVYFSIGGEVCHASR